MSKVTADEVREMRSEVERDRSRVQRLNVDAELTALVNDYADQLLAMDDEAFANHVAPANVGDWFRPSFTLTLG